MEHKKFEDITESEAQKITDDIWDAIWSDIPRREQLYSDEPFTRAMICYFMWKIKTNPGIKAPADLRDSYHVDYFYSYTLDMDDFSDVLEDPENAGEWDRVKKVADSYTTDELSACILKTDNLSQGSENYEEIPCSITDLSNRLLEIDSDDTVLDYNCGRGGYYFRSMIKNEPGRYICMSNDTDFRYIRAAFMRADVLGYNNCVFCDDDDRMYSDCYDDIDITKSVVDAFVVPGKRGTDIRYSEIADLWEEFPNNNNAWNDCACAIADMGFDGRAVALMTAGDLTVKMAEESRRFLCENGYVEGVIALPDKMFKSTWINSFLVILSAGNSEVKFLDARKKYIAKRENGKRVNVLSDELIDEILNDYNNNAIYVNREKLAATGFSLSPMRYLHKESIKTEYIELGDVLQEIRRGLSIKASEMDSYISDNSTGVQCIKAANITNGIVDTNECYNGELKHPNKNVCCNEDILITKTGNPFRVAIADGRYLVIGNIYILKVVSYKISPYYVKCFLSSDAGQKELRRLSVGSATPILNISDVKKIRIPVYDDRKQQELGRHSKEIEDELRSHYKQLRTSEEEIEHMFDEE